MIKNLKFKTQLSLLAGSAISLLIVVGIVSYLALNSVQRLSQLASDAASIKTEMLDLRKNEKDFLAREIKNTDFFETGTSKYYTKSLTTLNEMNLLLEKLAQSSYIIEHDLNKDLESIDENFHDYENTLSTLVQNIKVKGFKNYGLEGDLRTSIHTVEQAIKDYNLSSEYSISMLTLRRREKDFMLRNDVSYRDKFNIDLSKFTEMIYDDNKVSEENRTILIKELNNYKQKFNALVDQTIIIGLNEKEGKLGELRAAAHEIEPKVNALVEHITTESKHDISTAINTLFIIISIGILLFIGLSIFIVRALINQLGGEPAEVSHITKQIADGNLNVMMEKDYTGIMASIYQMTIQLKKILQEINTEAEQISTASQELSGSSEQLSQASNEQAASIEEVSSTMEEIASNIQQTADNAMQTDKISGNAFKGIKEANTASQNSMQSINSIAEKITIINDIAFQTNILALNAAVEAARAGEHGKGFAVVAAEVRKLAERSKLAATEIVEQANLSVQLTQNATSSLDKILPDIETTGSLIHEISASSNEQRNGAEQVNASIQQMNNVTQQNSASSEEIASSAEELHSQAETLRNSINYFKI